MKIAICDDCADDVSVINDILTSDVLAGSNKIYQYTSSEKLLHSVEKGVVYDVVFLDVDMPNVNGLELGKAIKETCPDTYIVYVTSYPQFAIDAYECEAFYYLLKPVDRDRINHVMKKIVKKYQEYNKSYKVRVKSRVINLHVRDIYYIECCRKHIIYHMKDHDYEAVGKISTVYDDLKDYGFYQVHQGYIVNMDKIKMFDKYNAILDDDRKVMISVRKKAEVMMAYSKYIEAHL